MDEPGLALFDTPIGRCGIAWRGAAVAGVQLPEARDTQVRAHLSRRLPAAVPRSPPPPIARVIEWLGALLRGEPAELARIELDLAGVPAFHRRVYAAARAIPIGATCTYGELARSLGAPGAARAVGQALARNPVPLIVPCHRVLGANGRAGGFSASGGAATKLRLLAIERAHGALGAGYGDGRALGFDPAQALAHLRDADPALGRLIDAIGPFRMRLQRTPSLFAALAEAIIHQQLSGRAAATIHARVCALFPNVHVGPTAAGLARLSDTRLREAGLSAAKVAALRDLAQRSRAGELPALAAAQRMDDAALIERLTRVRGIGRWTVEMLLIFRLGRADVLPLDDYGIRKGFAAALGRGALPSAERLARRGARWRPYRTVASWYLWRAAERAR